MSIALNIPDRGAKILTDRLIAIALNIDRIF
jgi:hypothetical protein